VVLVMGMVSGQFLVVSSQWAVASGQKDSEQLSVTSDQKKTDEKSKIEVQYKDDKLSVEVENAEIKDVLKMIGEVAGVKMEIREEISWKLGKEKFEDLTLEDGLQRLIGGTGFGAVIEYKEDLPVAIKVSKKEEKEDTLQKYIKTTLCNVPWGDAPNEFGFPTAPHEELGPTFYTITSKNIICILDAVKKRILVFDEKGKYLRTIKLEVSNDYDLHTSEADYVDICIDSEKNIYIHSQY